MEQDIQEILWHEEDLSARVKILGEQINRDYEGKKLLLVGILKGAVVFLADLMRVVNNACRVDFMRVSSYGDGTQSMGRVQILKDLEIDIQECDVLLVEDILDSGNTLSYLKKILLERNPKSLRVCVLLDKPERREVEIYADYVGFSIPNSFVVGYGLDYDEKYRNLPYIGVLKPEIYTQSI